MDTMRKAELLASIYNKNGTISKAKLRRVLFTAKAIRTKDVSISDFEFNCHEDFGSWGDVLELLTGDRDCDDWEYDGAVSTAEHTSRFTDYVLRRMGVLK